MSNLNLGIVAHVDAGKTSLTERLLFETGAIDAPGRVDDGTTRTDSLDLERRRGITIRAAVTSFSLGDTQVNVIDTPGHPDFIAEVERSLVVLDAAVLVLCGVEGVQAQTIVLWRALRRLGIPVVLFVNKIDRRGAVLEAVVAQVADRLTSAVDVRCRVEQEGDVTAYVLGMPGPATPAHVPLLAGSAITGAGLPQLCEQLRSLASHVPAGGGADDPPSATVFTVDRDATGARRAWIRLWAGQIRARQRLHVDGRRTGPVTQLLVSRPGGLQPVRAVGAGEIVAIPGLPMRIGDVIGAAPRATRATFAPPVLETLVEPIDPAQRPQLWAALSDLADEDPLIALRLEATTGEAAISLHGEVQKDVIGALLAERYAVPTRFSGTSVVCVESVLGCGADTVRLGAAGNPYVATVGLAVAPLPVGRGVVFDPGVERGKLPPAFITATAEGVRSALLQGLRGWEVSDVQVTMTASGYYPRQSRMHQAFDKAMSSVAADFRNLSPMVLFAALAQARTQVCEPVERIEIDIPERLYAVVASLVARVGGYVDDTRADGRYVHLEGLVATARLGDLTSRLPDASEGEAILLHRFDHHAPVTGRPPVRARRGPDPLDRKRWVRARPR